MALESKISDIIATLQPDATYLLASKFRADLQSFNVESAALPLIVLDNEIPKDNEIENNANILKNTRILIYFLDKDSPDNTDAQTRTIQSTMELIADQVAFNIYRLEEIRPSGKQKYKTNPVFHIWNTDLSGVILDILVRENVVISIT